MAHSDRIRPAIRLNGVALPPHMIAAEAQHHPARTPAAAFQAAARALIIRTLLLEEAARQGLEAEPELVAEGKRETAEEAKIRQLLEHFIPVREVSEADCRAYYDSHAGQFRSPELVEASHILFAVDPRNADAPAKAQAAAHSALAELSRHPDLFERLARERSDCSSKSGGGRLGQLAPGDTVPEFEAALSSLQPGEIAPAPIQTRFGFHLLRLDARIAGKPLPFSYVQEKVAAFLGERQWRQDVALFIARLIETAEIDGVDMRAGKAA
jgi:peptidyl-prolyl cis-trans isomerase C